MATVFRLPDIGEGLTEAEIVEWLADVGEEVRADHPLVVVETDKTQAELPAPVTGILLHRGAGEGSILEVGEILAVVGERGEQWDETAPTVGAADSEESSPHRIEARHSERPATRPAALPLVRRAAAEAGVDLAAVAGTGPGGRITRQDLADHLASRTDAGERPPLVGTLDHVAEDVGAGAPTPAQGDRTIRLGPTRRAIAERLTAAWREIPHVTTYDDFDASAILDRRRELAAELGTVVPLEVLVIHSIVPVLGRHPEFNATLVGDELTLHGRYDVGFAVDGGDGLLVAVVANAGDRTLQDLAAEVRRLADAARSRALTRNEMTGATFTVSNIGAVGGGYGTPIIPLGTTAILSVGRAADSVVVRDGGIHVAPMAPLSLSYDHRVIDGAAGRAFMADLVAALEDPGRSG